MELLNFGPKKLGFGCMRLPMSEGTVGGEGVVDTRQVCAMVDAFLEQGFCYFDTAHGYIAQKSEPTVRQCLVERHPRDRYLLTDKLSGTFFQTEEEIRPFFESQLEITGAGYFDFYLMHALNANQYQKFTECNAFQVAQQLKNEGKIRHVGISFHDTPEVLEQILSEHPEIEVVQIQFNYADLEDPKVQSLAVYEVCRRHGKPVIVMEPVKGGTLARVPESVEKMFREARPEMSIPSWAIRFAASLEHVMVVLSGMSNMEQLLDNTDYMADFQPLSAQEQALVKKAVDAINSTIAIPCTGCSYCTEGCPQRIAIPKYFSLYNADLQEIKEKSWRPQGEYYTRLTMNFGKASDCLECGQCEQVCPQHLPIIRHLKDVAARFEK